MITLNNITMGFPGRTLFKDVTLSIFPNERIGLTGPNGAGKSTLYSIIRGQIEPTEGIVQIQKNIHIGYLPQEAKFSSKRTVLDEVTSGDQRIQNLLDEKRKLEEKQKAATDHYGDVVEKLEQLGIYDIEHKAEKILMGLGFKESDFDRPIVELSGGWQMRVLLAKLLTYPYELLLLDEPTNYLDLEATLWLKDYLATYPGAFVLISHDRKFLNDVTNYTIVLDRARLTKIKGNYEFYETQKDTDLKTLEKKQKVVEKKRKQLERFAERFHAQPNRAAAVKNKRRMIEKLDEIELPQEHRSASDFKFDDIKESGYVVASVKDVSKSYGENQIYKDFNFEILKGQKVCLVGPNGAGKSTLLKMLAGVLESDSGEIKYGHNVDYGYFSQTRLDVLNPNRSAFDEVGSASAHGIPALRIRSLLALFSFHGDDVFKTVNILSGGEKSRLILAKLLINPPNFMLLDEPTTHLDMDGVKALTNAFQEFKGTLCFISHDLYFIEEIADVIVEILPGKVTVFPGGLEYYLYKKQGKAVEEKKLAKKVKERNKNVKENVKLVEDEDTPSGNSKVKDLYEQHKQAKRRLTQIKTELKNLEQERKDIETESYVKARKLSEGYENRDAEIFQEYGKRLKDIQSRLREIESTIQSLKDERDRISK